MRRSSTFWALVLIALGCLLLLDNVGVFRALGVRVWALIGPLFLVVVGLWILLGTIAGRPSAEVKEASVPLGDATHARIRLKHAAGRLVVGSGAGAGELVSGSFAGGLDYRARREGDRLRVQLETPASAWPIFGPWAWQQGLDWDCRLSGTVPLDLDLEIGANEARLDLQELRVTNLRLKTGASSTEVVLPAHAGHTKARLEAGAASLAVQVPGGVAARIRVEGALAGVDVDRARFPREGGAYQSPGYDGATDRVDLTISAAVGSVSVR